MESADLPSQLNANRLVIDYKQVRRIDCELKQDKSL